MRKKNAFITRLNKDVIPGFFQALRLIMRSSAKWTFINILLTIVQGGLPLLALLIVQKIVDSVGSAHGTGQWTAVLWWIIASGVLILGQTLFQNLYELASESQAHLIARKINDLIHAKSIEMDLSYYEDASYFDALHRAQKEAGYRPGQIFQQLLNTAKDGLSVLGILAILFYFHFLAGLVVILSILPSAVIHFVFSKKRYQIERNNTENERRSWYYHWLITDQKAAKEVRLYRVGPLFKQHFSELFWHLHKDKIKVKWERFKQDMWAQLVTVSALIVVLAWVGRETLAGVITLGTMVMYLNGFQKGQQLMVSLFRGTAQLYEHSLFLVDFFAFLKLTPKIKTPDKPVSVPSVALEKSGLHLFHVSFSYPGQTSFVLRDICLDFKPGQMVALVGHNGSGKTTLVKLLARLYDPDSGEIVFNGTNINQFDLVEWRNQLGIIFQDYQHYNMKVWENIWLGDEFGTPNMAKIQQAAGLSGADGFIKSLPKGYDTVLGHLFHQGHELSEGEWQKIALTRLFLSHKPFIILDEPTSFLDPAGERDFFSHLRQYARDTGIILVSHRFSAVTEADYIYVLSEGRIIEQGIHDELIGKNGFYARFYHVKSL